jgi:outer membrane biosynthesis protein TonB
MKTLRWFIIVCVALACLSFILADSQASVDQEVAHQAVDTNPPAEIVKLIFIHHSCGENWLGDYHGGLGLALQDNNYFVSDTNYGWGPEGVGDRTDIGYWWDWFRGPNRDTYLNALYTESNRFGDYYSRLRNDPGGENQIIMFKSCFPNSYLEGSPGDPPTIGDNPIRGQESWSEPYTVANAKGLYNDILEYFATRQDKLFIAVTAPPLMDGETDAAHAANARGFNNWLVNEWLAGYPHNNVAVFDFYNVLTSSGGDPYTHDAGQESGNHHRIWNGAVQHIQTVSYDMAAYPDGDSHPTPAGNQKATAEFVPLLNYYYSRWKPGQTAPAAPPTATPAEEQPAPAEQDTPVAKEDAQPEDAQPAEEPVSVEGVIDSLDASLEFWESSGAGESARIDFGVDNDVVYNGTGSLRIQYSLKPDSWGDCGRYFDAVQDWSGGNGLSMWLRSDKAGPANFMLFSGDQGSPTPFETIFEIPPESVGNWVEVILPWTVFERAHWADEGGLTEFDPTRVTGLGINFWADNDPNEGTLWIDDLSLATGEMAPPEKEEEEPTAELTAEPVEPTEETAEEPVETAEPTEPEASASAETPAAPVEPTQAAEPAAAPVEEESSGGLCPFSMIMLPLMLVTVVLSRKFTKDPYKE